MRDYSFGNFLHELRARRGLSQYQLGMLVGVSNKAVSKWENGSAKPQSRTLYRLSEVLGVTVDELLSCKYRSTENKNHKGVFAMKKVLWKKAEENLASLYGKVPPVEVANRYFSEYAELKDTDQIIYFELLSRMAKSGAHGEGRKSVCEARRGIERDEKCGGVYEAESDRESGESHRAEYGREHGEVCCSGQIRGHMYVNGSIGASFVAYLMGAVQVNPLRPHYYCPDCHIIRFEEGVRCGWDLPAEKCTCGRQLLREGHNIPFETLRPAIHKVPHYDICVSRNLFPTAQKIISDFFEGNQVMALTRKEPNVRTYVILEEELAESSIMADESGIWHEEHYRQLWQHPTITLIQNEELDACEQLEKETGVLFDEVPFMDKEVIQAFLDRDIDGIPEFKAEFARTMMEESTPISIHDLIQIAGLCHGTGVWEGNGQALVKAGMPIGGLIAWRDDVFCYIQEKMKSVGGIGTGYAYQIMEDVRRGVYAQKGIPEEIRQQLSELGGEGWFIESIGKICYLFPKAHGVARVKHAMILMWYKIYYPEAFWKSITIQN